MFSLLASCARDKLEENNTNEQVQGERESALPPTPPPALDIGKWKCASEGSAPCGCGRLPGGETLWLSLAVGEERSGVLGPSQPPVVAAFSGEQSQMLRLPLHVTSPCCPRTVREFLFDLGNNLVPQINMSV